MGKKVCVIIVLVNLILLGGGAVFIAWYSDHMVFPSFTIEQGAINGFNFTAANHLNALFFFIIHSHNNDPKYSIKYNQVVVSVYHLNGYSLTYESKNPYTEHNRKGTFFTSHTMARDVLIADPTVAAKIRNETMSGHLNLEVRVRVNVKYEVKRWKHKHYLLKAVCSPVVFNFTTWKTFNKTNCHTDSFET